MPRDRNPKPLCVPPPPPPVSSHSSYRHSTILRTIIPRGAPETFAGRTSATRRDRLCVVRRASNLGPLSHSYVVRGCVWVRSTRLYYKHNTGLCVSASVYLLLASASDVAKALCRYRHRHLQSPTPMTRAHNVGNI